MKTAHVMPTSFATLPDPLLDAVGDPSLKLVVLPNKRMIDTYCISYG